MATRLRFLPLVSMFLVVLLGSSALYAQFSWVNLTTLSGDLPNGQVGLTVLNGTLIMTWGNQGTNELMFSTSTDGIHWTAPQGMNGLVHADNTTQSGPPYASGGVNMTTSAVCNAAYVAWTGPDGNDIYVARTQDGQNWTYGGPLVDVPYPSGYSSPGTSSPALYGGSSQPIIEFAYPVPAGPISQPKGKGLPQPTIGYAIDVGQFNCDLSGVQLQGSNSCFFYDYGNNTCQASDASYLDYPIAFEFDEGLIQTISAPSGPWSPVWGGVEVKAISQGNPQGNAEPPTYFSINGGPYGTSGALQCLTSPSVGCPPSGYYNSAAQWTNNGGSVVVVPSSGTPFLAVTCAPVNDGYNGHLCQGPTGFFCWGCNGGQEPSLRTFDLVNDFGTGSLNWSPVAPAAIYFDNQIWFAMCAGYSCEGGITVGSVYPAQLTGCSYTAPDIYVPGSATTATGTIDGYYSKGGCIWGAFSGPGWPSGWSAVAAHGSGDGSYSFSVTPNNSGATIQSSITAADNQTVTVYQGTAGGSPGTGSVTIRYNPQRPGPSSGTVSVVVNGVTYSVGYSMPGETAEQVATGLVNEINYEPPDSAISASVSGSTVYITSNINGSNTNYSFSASQTFGGDGPSFSPVCAGSPSCSGLTLTGGSN